MTSQRRSPPLRETAGKVGFPRTRASLSRLSISSDRDGLGSPASLIVTQGTKRCNPENLSPDRAAQHSAGMPKPPHRHSGVTV
jgi:hypothetical protein